MKKFFKILTCFVLMIAVSVALVACGKKKNKDPETPKQPQIVITEVSNEQAFEQAISSTCDEIKLTSDISTDNYFTISRKVTINLNGKTLKGDGSNGVIYVKDNADVTITGNGTIIAKESSDRYAMAIWARDNSKVTIENGTFTQEITGTDSQYDMIYVLNNAQITILDGTFVSKTPKWTLNKHDTSTNSKIIVKGGTFIDYNPEQAMTEPNSPVSFVAEGYKVIQTGSIYKVIAE